VSDSLRRALTALSRYREGVHQLATPAVLHDAALPAALAGFYREHDGGELFHGALVLLPAASVRRDGDRFRVGELDGDELWVAVDGPVWRLEEDSGEWVEEGSEFDRWLAGWVDAQAVIYDRDGEFVDDVFDDDGEPTIDAAIAGARAALARDKGGVGPRWRLARALARAGEREQARGELEEVVARRPSFGWAWFDLSRLAEELGELESAHQDARAAAEADPGYEHAGFFWAQAARLAVRLGDEPRRAECAARALAAMPELVSAHRAAAAASLDEGDLEAAEEHAALAAALAPRDLQVLEVAGRVEDRRQATGDRRPATGDGEDVREQESDRGGRTPPEADPPRRPRGTGRPPGGRRRGRRGARPAVRRRRP